MGGSASRELEVAQSQVRHLTAQLHLQKQQVTRVATNHLAEAAAAAQKELEKTLSATRAELASTAQQLQQQQQQLVNVNDELPKFKREIATAREELLDARKKEEEKGTQLSVLQLELRSSKEELEQLFGKLKFAEQESAKVRAEGRSAEKRELAEQQKAAAEASVRLVTEASAALLDSEREPHAHPVFGELLADFGHKRLYRGSPTTLWAGTMLWERQRAFRPERATLIAQAKGKSANRGWPGSISIVEASPSHDAPSEAATHSSIGLLIDGQHRLGAAHLLAKKGRLKGALEQILVEVYTPREEAAIKELFTEINRAEPVLLVDLPDESGGASADDNAVITSAAEALRERYPAMFKPSHACRSPHVNVDVLRAHLFSAEVLGRYEIESPEQLVAWVEARNAELAARPDGEWGDGRKKNSAALEKALSKAREHKFFLGLSWEWLEQG